LSDAVPSGVHGLERACAAGVVPCRRSTTPAFGDVAEFALWAARLMCGGVRGCVVDRRAHAAV